MITPEEIQEHYDSLALIYRTFWGDHLHHGLFTGGSESSSVAQVKLLEHCLTLLDPRGRENVLDVGCGFGATLLYLVQRFDMRGIGVTISLNQAQVAKQKAAEAGVTEQLGFIVADADRFCFPVECFDVIWVMESSEHLFDKPSLFQNAQAALRPGGRLVLASWNGDMERSRVAAVARAFLCPELWTVNQYRSAIQIAGMKVRECQDLTDGVLPTWKICREKLRAADGAVKLLPHSVRQFLGGIELILHAYTSGDLEYNLLVAEK